jgi:hypothetical protein
MAQDEDLQVLGGITVDQQHKQADQAAQHQVGELGQHAENLHSVGSGEAPRYRPVLQAN